MIFSCTAMRNRSPKARLRWRCVFGAPVAPLGSSGLPRGTRHLDACIPSPSRLAGRRPPGVAGTRLALSVHVDSGASRRVGGSIPLIVHRSQVGVGVCKLAANGSEGGFRVLLAGIIRVCNLTWPWPLDIMCTSAGIVPTLAMQHHWLVGRLMRGDGAAPLLIDAWCPKTFARKIGTKWSTAPDLLLSALRCTYMQTTRMQYLLHAWRTPRVWNRPGWARQMISSPSSHLMRACGRPLAQATTTGEDGRTMVGRSGGPRQRSGMHWHGAPGGGGGDLEAAAYLLARVIVLLHTDLDAAPDWKDQQDRHERPSPLVAAGRVRYHDHLHHAAYSPIVPRGGGQEVRAPDLEDREWDDTGDQRYVHCLGVVQQLPRPESG